MDEVLTIEARALMVADDELVVLRRRDYDSLLACLGDEDAEDRMMVRVVEDSTSRIDLGEDVELPVEAWRAIEAGASPVRLIRETRGLSSEALAKAAGLSPERLHQIEQSPDAPTNIELAALGLTLHLNPNLLRDPLAA